MISFPIQTCLDSQIFAQVIVSTEDDEITEIAASAGARVICRPKELATDEIHEGHAHNHVLDTLKQEGLEPEYFLVLYSTAVLVNSNDIIQSDSMMRDETLPDAVMSMSPYPNHPYKAFVKRDDKYWEPMYPKECKMQTQTYPHVLAVNGTFCWVRTDAWRQNMHYFPDRFACYEMPLERAIDIDTPEDYERAKVFCNLLQKNN